MDEQSTGKDRKDCMKQFRKAGSSPLDRISRNEAEAVAMSWSLQLDEPIILTNGKKLSALKDAIAWWAKEVPKSEHTMGAGCRTYGNGSSRDVARCGQPAKIALRV